MNRSTATAAAALMGLILSVSARAEPVHIGPEAIVPEQPRSRYNRFVNWRPADGEMVRLNPPRMSWPYIPDWPRSWSRAQHMFQLQISADPGCKDPVVDVTTPVNFYNTIPALRTSARGKQSGKPTEVAGTWYWRVGYDIGTERETWSQVRSFTIAADAQVWDRAALARPQLAERGHPRICFNAENLDQVRRLADTDAGSRAALDYMRSQADRIIRTAWWERFPTSDTAAEPKQDFYKIAHDLAMVCFVWRMTGDDKYAGVKERAVTWASYPPGGRASPEGLGGDGNEDATQGNEFLALLFDWLYPDLDDNERLIMIHSLEWRVDHVMNSFAWREKGSRGPMLRLTFRTPLDADAAVFEAEDCELTGGARVIGHEKASSGKLVEFAGKKAAIRTTLKLDAGTYAVTIRGYGPAGNQDGFYVALDDQKPTRLFISGWDEKSVPLTVPAAGAHELVLCADPNEVGMTVDSLRLGGHTGLRLKLRTSREWKDFEWEVPVPHGTTSLAVEPFNYYAAGEVWWDLLHLATPGSQVNLLANGDFQSVADGKPHGWASNACRTDAKLTFAPQGGRDNTGAIGIQCPSSSDRGAWQQTVPLENVRKLIVHGRYQTSAGMMIGAVKASGLSGMIASHPYEASMDTAVCGLALYEHSSIGREWFEVMLNYLIGITCGHGFNEGWNEGAGYGTSKCKWLANASMYFDTALPQAELGRNPFYSRLGEWFSRIIPVGMPHHAWGNQSNSSRWNHLAHFRKFAYLTGNGRFLLNWQEYGGKQFSNWRPWIEFVLPATHQLPAPEPESGTVGVFPIAGWAMAATGPPSLRSTYEEGLGVVFQCRSRGGYGHSFNSDGSFQLHAYGQMLNHGGGSSANLDAFAYHTMSHNTVLVDGLGQAQPGGVQTRPAYGRIVGFARGPDHVYFAGDVTGCYPTQPGRYGRWGLPLHKVYEERALPHLQRFVRHILFVRNRYFVIYDDLACSIPATYTWLYHILPESPLQFDRTSFALDYAVGDVNVRLQHLAHPQQLKLDDREKLDGLVNPVTGEDYTRWRKGEILCGHNLWISNSAPAREWRFVAVVYPAPPGDRIPEIEGIGPNTIRVGADVICFEPASTAAPSANFVVDVAAFRAAASAH